VVLARALFALKLHDGLVSVYITNLRQKNELTLNILLKKLVHLLIPLKISTLKIGNENNDKKPT